MMTLRGDSDTQSNGSRSRGSTTAFGGGTLRIPALRAGFEVLLDADMTKNLATRLSRLLGDESVPVERSWRERPDADVSTAEMTDVAWWFKQFSLLRNDLMHGRVPGEDRWFDDHGTWQTDLGEWYLRQAIKHAIADNGHPELLTDLIWP